MERRPLSVVEFSPDPALPITKVIPELLEAIERNSKLILTAPPGAGKTTIVPLALLAAGKIKGRIIVLEPRRLAARAAAERMAQNLNEAAGDTVGVSYARPAKNLDSDAYRGGDRGYSDPNVAK